ncbi:MAG: 5-(carboxyamino)imidazole ribonucleotide synthase [Nanoarchaeota archaeon]|nr:5-(carboxyamino)imidazole ribonucleotide synthase [Nanoarchaeota archaeon]
MKPKVLVLSGYGVNCESETKYAFDLAGGDAEIVHINDLISGESNLEDYQIMAFPGGFSFGDDTGSGNAMANKIKLNLFDSLMRFIHSDKLIIGICNGFQILVNLGLLPALKGDYGKREVALTFNNSAQYECRWINLKKNSEKCVFTNKITHLHIPVAHGEGRFFAEEDVLKDLWENNQIVFTYSNPGGEPANGEYPWNPNGSLKDIAAICDRSGKIFGMMPHPERAILMASHPDFQKIKEGLKRKKAIIPEYYDPALTIFRNAVEYVKEHPTLSRDLMKRIRPKGFSYLQSKVNIESEEDSKEKEKTYKEAIQNNLNNVITSGMFPGLGKHKSGKVRDVHFTSDKIGSPIIMVASDRVSAFDHILDKSIPFKGAVLNLLSMWALNNTKDIIKNSLIESPHSNVIIQKYCRNLGIECVVRGYVWGSLASSYEKGERKLCGEILPEGLIRYGELDEPIFTPTAKSEHDESLTFEEVSKILGPTLAKKVKETSIALYKRGAELAEKRGLIFIDTKYEFGLDENGELTLIDEANTPDSSRYCSMKEYRKFAIIEELMKTGKYNNVSDLLKQRPELKITEMSKQFVRDILTEQGFSYGGQGRPPSLTNDQVVELSYRYIRLYERLTGENFIFPSANAKEQLIKSLGERGYKLTKTIGCIGGGQLLRMMGEAIKKADLPFEIVMLDPSNPCPASPYASKHIVGDLKDPDKIRQVAEESDILTYELEHTNAEILQELEKEGKIVYPSPKILSIIQDKFKQKEFLRANGFPVPEYLAVSKEGDIIEGVHRFGFPALLKACYGSYDGKGNMLIDSPESIGDAYRAFQQRGSLILEKFIDFEREISVIIARDIEGNVRCYEVGENLHLDNILRRTIVPARVNEKIKAQAKEMGERIVNLFNGVGVFCIEMFLTKDGKIMINEIAPRVHNSGHYTIEACKTSQFEQHVRAITGMPLGDTEIIAPAIMVNVLGPEGLSGPYKIEAPAGFVNNPHLFIHDYGKSESRPKRKIGHMTYILKEPHELLPLVEVKSQ